MDTMTIHQAFETMVWFLKQFQDRGPFEDIAFLLRILNRVRAGNNDDDALALWEEWRISVKKTQHFSGQPNEFPLFELEQTSWDVREAFPDLPLTIMQAYEATQLFLYRQYLKTKVEDGGLFFLVSNMDLGVRMDFGLWPYPIPADPAFWPDWMGSVQKVLLPDTPENQLLVQDLISHNENYLGEGPFGEEWYGLLLSDGRQLWAEVYHGKLQCAGIRRIPVAFDPRTGLSTPVHP